MGINKNWIFEKYGEKSTKIDPSSEKFFKGQSEVDSLIRESVQNSLDAVDNEKKPVKLVFKNEIIEDSFCKSLNLGNLKKHLQECEIKINNDKKINFIIIEDFNTKGLENSLEDFFYSDNITNKSTGGGSHGIGKAVFPSFSKMKTFFGYSRFANSKSVFQGRSVLKTHDIGNKSYRPYGNIEIEVKNNVFIKKAFDRKQEKGLSIAIPSPNQEELDNMLIKNSFIDQCYIPILEKKLEIELEGETISDGLLLEKESQRSKINLIKKHLSEKKSIGKDSIQLKYDINRSLWKKEDIPLKKIERLEEKNYFYFYIIIDLPKKDMKGRFLILLKRDDDSSQDNKIDFWRGDLLITKAAGRQHLPKGFVGIVLINDFDGKTNPLKSLLRKLEDPGHTKWETGTIDDDIKEKYGNKTEIKSLVKYIRCLPKKLAKRIQDEQPQNLDSNFFSEYFPRTSGKDGSQKGGKSSPMPNILINSEDFNYRDSKDKRGFSLTLKNKEQHPDNVSIKVAYGTNMSADAFKYYSEDDFRFFNDIKIEKKGAELLEHGLNWIKYKITDKSFSASFLNFDPDRELKIEVKSEKN